MGIYDRDYYRKDPEGAGGLLGGEATVCKRLIAINIAVYVLQFITYQFGGGVTEWLELDPAAVLQSGQVWRILTFAFCHAIQDPMHIVFNMLFLWWFGHPLEAMYGSREFLRFYLAAAIISGLSFLALAVALGTRNPAIGASGAVMAVVIVYAMYNPRQQIYVMFIIPVELRWLVPLYVIWDLFPVLTALGGGEQAVRDNVAHAAHLGGFLYGFLYKWYDLRFEHWLGAGMWPRFRLPRRKAPMKIYRPPEEKDLDQQLDEILAKISAQGEASLTDHERQILKEASRRYKDR